MRGRIIDFLKVVFVGVVVVFTLLAVWVATNVSFTINNDAPGLFGGKSCVELSDEMVKCGSPLEATTYIKVTHDKFPRYGVVERDSFKYRFNYAYWLCIYAGSAMLFWFITIKLYKWISARLHYEVTGKKHNGKEQ